MTTTNNQSDQNYQDDINKLLTGVQEKLDIFESSVLPKIQKSLGQEYLDMDIELLKKKEPDELAEIVVVIRRYSLFIRQELNKLRSARTWCLSKIDDIAGEQLQHISNTFGWNERMLIAKTQHPVCKVIQSKLREFNCKIDRLTDVCDEINLIANSINDLRFSILSKRRVQE